MEKQSYMREFIRYVILSVLGTLGVSCYILADTFFVSKGLGTNGLAALNLAIPVYNFIHGTGLMLGMGGATRFSIYKSQGRDGDADRTYTNVLYLALLFSAVFFVLGLLVSRQMAAALGADAGTLEMTDTYLKWILLFAPAFILNNVLLCFVRNDGEPQLSMAAMLVGSLSNIVLDYVFIFPMGMGIFGAVFATGLSPIISILLMTPHWIRKKNTFHLVRTRPEPRLAGQTLSLGFPSLLAQVSSGVVMMVFNGLILGLEGNTGVAAYGVTANISLVVLAVYTGIGQGIQPLISTFYGTGKEERARRVFGWASVMVLAFSAAVYLAVFFFARPIAAVFNSEHDLQLQKTAVEGLKLYFISAPFIGYNTILAVYFTSVEQALPAHILSILRGFLLILPAAFGFSALWGMTGIWLACPAAEALAAVPGLVLYRRRARKKQK